MNTSQVSPRALARPQV